MDEGVIVGSPLYNLVSFLIRLEVLFVILIITF